MTKEPGHYRKPGRPKSAYGDKSSRSFYITDEANDALKTLAKDFGAKSASDLLEKIAHRDVVLQSVDVNRKSAKDEMTMQNRLHRLYQDPVAVFWSVLAFADRVSSQLGISLNEEELSAVVMKAMLMLFYRDYLQPDIYIDPIATWLRWYVLQILKCQAKDILKARDANPNLTYDLNDRFGNTIGGSAAEKQRKICISTIYSARRKLVKSDSPNAALNVLKLRIETRLSLGQIHMLCQDRYLEYTGLELVKYGLAKFRELWLNVNDKSNKIPEQEKNKIPEAFLYAELAQVKHFNVNNLEKLEALLIGGLMYVDYDSWANEIDYFFECLESKDNSAYRKKQETILFIINRDFENLLEKRKKELDKILFTRISTKKGLNRLSAILEQKVSEALGSRISPLDLNPLMPMRQIIDQERKKKLGL
ncbi:MAG: hypothetical protein ACFB0C_07955 [Leptolyngbyaceae cyanobacterium]